jgi:hypothetical protein
MAVQLQESPTVPTILVNTAAKSITFLITTTKPPASTAASLDPLLWEGRKQNRDSYQSHDDKHLDILEHRTGTKSYVLRIEESLGRYKDVFLIPTKVS